MEQGPAAYPDNLLRAEECLGESSDLDQKEGCGQQEDPDRVHPDYADEQQHDPDEGHWEGKHEAAPETPTLCVIHQENLLPTRVLCDPLPSLTLQGEGGIVYRAKARAGRGRSSGAGGTE